MKESKIEDRGSKIAIGPPPSSIFHPRSLVLVALYLAFLHSTFAGALEVPRLRGRVNDYAGLIPADRAQALESRLAAFEQETGHQIAVLTIPSLEGDPLEDFSIRVAESWKIGQKGFDNGAILLIAQKDRKLRIEVGYGLEGVLPDAIANRIIREVIVPRLRENDYSGGIEAGVNAILQVTKGETLPQRTQVPRPQATSRLSSAMNILIITAMLALFIGMTRRRIAGGAFGGAAAGFAATLFSAGGFGLILILALIIGALLGAIGSSMSVASSSNQWTGGSRDRRGGGFL
ncbi:MAG TPA: YgcG family protein, partial [Candidatus Binatia bacterium]|nr:YgcG family protein [Candidatus Binatia bacterium]